MLNREQVTDFFGCLLIGISRSFFLLSRVQKIDKAQSIKENLNNDWEEVRNDFFKALEKFKVKQNATKKKKF